MSLGDLSDAERSYFYGETPKKPKLKKSKKQKRKLLDRSYSRRANYIELPNTEPTGLVYFIGAPAVNRVKIGYTSREDVRGRLNDLETGSPVDLEVMGVMLGTVELERALHALFSSYRVRREWFTLSDEIYDFIIANTK